MTERGKYQIGALKYLYEMELVDDPQLINNLKMNILMVSKHIKEVEFIASYHRKQMLVWIELNWWGRKFLKSRIKTSVYEILTQLLPNFSFRVTEDYSILELAQQKITRALSGESYENDNDSSSTDGIDDGISEELSETSNLLPNQEKQSGSK